MTDNKPTIEFPCQYPIKVIGYLGPDFKTDVLRTIKAITTYDEVSENLSSNQRYISLSLTIKADSEAMIKELFSALSALDSVKMVL